MSNAYGVMTDYEYGTTHKRDRVVVWSSPFMSVYEAEGFARMGATYYTLETYNGDKVRAVLPAGVTAPRTNENYQQIDSAISDALTAFYARPVRCCCAHNTDGSTTTMLCPVHADSDPCETFASVTGRRRKGSNRSGRCTECGHVSKLVRA